MKLALLIGVRDDDPRQRLQPEPGLAAIEGLLLELGDWTSIRIDGSAATRSGILEGLGAIARIVNPDDDVLVYFFGHGGVVEILDLPPPLGGRPVFYIAAARTGEGWSFEAVLDVELSLALARVDAICGNVSVILDCCYAARTARGPGWQLQSSPAWVREVAEQTTHCDGLLAPESHPRIVRLTASSSLRWAYAEDGDSGHLGRMTRGFVEVLREAGPHVDRLTWDAVAHRVREQVIWQMGCEDQWVTLAGPRDRILFSRRQAEPARTVPFIPHESQPGGWIRAGLLQGVSVGDQWGLAQLTRDERLRLRCRARMRVSAVELNRAALEPIDAIEGPVLPGTSAYLLGARTRQPVFVDESNELAAAVDASSLLCSSHEFEGRWLAKLSSEGAHVELHPRSADLAPVRFAADELGIAAAIDCLEDWARARLLLDLVESHPAASSDSLRVRWGRIDAGRPRELASDDPTLRLQIGERVYFSISHCGHHGDWFVCAVEIGVDGRPTLLNASEPEGHEIRPGDTIHIGRRAHRRLEGLELTWPADVPSDRPRPVTVLLLASPRPLLLGHLAGDPRRDFVPRFEPPRRRAGRRSHLDAPRPHTGPEPIHEWAWQAIRYQLDPNPASNSPRSAS